MQHKKKVSDFLIDGKISVADKETITVLESEKEIVWVVGQRIDERYKIIDSTTSTVTCRLIVD
jgi:tRNA(Ile)-lysidine synthase